MKSPMVYFGGKSIIAPIVWQRFGNVPNYIEPFMGSAAVLLSRPMEHFLSESNRYETVNDFDCMIPNFWRALQADPELVAELSDYPIIEADLHARHASLVKRKPELRERIEADPHYYDLEMAAWWIWGMSIWIGGGFCSGDGTWSVIDGKLQKGGEGEGVNKKVPQLRDSLGIQQYAGIDKRRPHIGNSANGINQYAGIMKQVPYLKTGSLGYQSKPDILTYFQSLARRLRKVRVCYGDFARVLTDTPTIHTATPCAVFLDPPYSTEAGRDMNIYSEDSGTVAHRAREWALQRGDDPRFRIALCGYEGEHNMPDSWECVEWKANGGYSGRGDGKAKENAKRERVWFSPHCLKPEKTAQISMDWEDEE